MPDSPERDSPDQEQPFVSHLLELRDRLLRMVVGVLAIFLCLFPFANDLYVYVAAPLMRHMPAGTSMIATGVATPFLTPFKLSLVAAVFLAMPYILYQFWAFVAPGLYRHEKRLVMPLLVSSSFLFYLGMLFAYYVVFPLVFAFFVGTAPEGVAVMTDISQYLDFVLTLFFAFGVAFEVPIATVLLVWMGITTPESMAGKRPYVIVGAFVIGMLLTPPDVISQSLLALPMWVLFEMGVQASRFFVRTQDGERNGETSVGGTDDEPGKSAPGDLRTSAPDASGGPVVGAELLGDDARDADRYRPMTDEEMEAELDAIEAMEDQLERAGDGDDHGATVPEDPVDMKLRRVQLLRDAEDESGARALLYQVLSEGNEEQRGVARNILEQMDMS